MVDPDQRQRLDHYRLPEHFSVGVPWLQLMLWFCAGSPLLASRCLPGSAWRIYLLRIFGAQIGIGCRLKPGLRVKYPWRLQVGPHCWLGEDVWIDNLAEVCIGEHACLSQGVYLCTGNHNYRSAGFDLCCAPIVIGDGAWLAAQVTVAPGVKVGSDAVVGIGSVVLSSVPDAVVWQGNPAQFRGWRWRRSNGSAAPCRITLNEQDLPAVSVSDERR